MRDDEAPGLDDRAREGLDHLQAAAKEMIRAARVLLDVAEELVDDPATVQSVVGAVGSVASAAMGRMRAGPPSDADEGPDGDDGRVHRIRIS